MMSMSDGEEMSAESPRTWGERLRGWRSDDRWGCLIAYALILLWCLPLLLQPHAFGVPDWDWFHSYFFAVRESILGHGQFPGYNPWMYMGSPLWANPQIGPISYLTPWVLLCGPVVGLKLGVVTCYLLSFEAGRALGRELFSHPLAAVMAGLLYALNTALASQWIMGHFCFAAYPLLPWLVLWCLRLHSHRTAGLWAGVLAGCMVQLGIHYYMVYGLFLCAILSLTHGVRQRAWRGLVRFVFTGALAFVALAATKLLPVLFVMRDFPRKLDVPFSLSLSQLGKMFFLPSLGPMERWLSRPFDGGELALVSNAFFAYVGILVLLLALWSLRKGIRFFHVGALLSLWLLVGNSQAWQLSNWLGLLPPFDSMWVFTRWRLVFLACMAFAAAQGIDVLLAQFGTQQESDAGMGADVEPAAEAPETKGGGTAPATGTSWSWRTHWPMLAIWLVPLELILLLMPSWWASVTSYRYPSPEITRKQLKLPKTDHILPYRQLRTKAKNNIWYYPLFAQNVGATKGYEPLFGYRPVIGAHVFVGHPGYLGQYVISGGKAVKPSSWSPNRIVFEGLAAGKTLWLNMTPGKGWSVNGKPLYERDPTFMLQKYFLVKVPPSGRIELRYEVPGLMDGLWISLMCLLMLVYLQIRERRAKEAEGEGVAQEKSPALPAQ